MNKQMIINLILRDFRVFFKSILGLSVFMLIMGMFTTFINTNTIRIFSTGFGGMVICVVISSFVMEQQNAKIRMHTASLPVTREATLIARYLSTLIISVINLFIWILAFNVLEGSLKPEPNYLVNPQVILFTFMYLLLQLSLYFFSFYRFNLIVVMIIYFIPILSWTAISSQNPEIFNPIIDNTNSLVVFSLISLALFVTSFFVNLAYFKKKEL